MGFWGKRVLAAVLLLVMFCAPGLSSPALAGGAPDQARYPAEIALSMTSDPGTSMTINWTTLDTTLTNPLALVWESGRDERTAVEFTARVTKRNVAGSTIADANRKQVKAKNFYTASVTGLKPDTQYNYRCGASGAMSEVRAFKTAPGYDEEYTFIFAADPQVTRYHSNAWQANLDIMKKMYPDASFMLVAGDWTDSNNEGEWESFFNQSGNAQYNAVYGGALISEIPVAGVVGDHDGYKYPGSGIYTHFSFESHAGGVPVTYAFDYGPARFIILDLEDPYSLQSSKNRAAQAEFLKREVAQAKAEGKWTVVSFHESLYSGATHMATQDGVIFSRKYWGPLLAGLDVDAVLAGHDHVLSRGFVRANGSNANATVQLSDREYAAVKPDNAPLYFTGGCASTRKFYNAIISDKYFDRGDPIARQLGYLDLCSALPAGFVSPATGKVLNPGPCTYTTATIRMPSFTAVMVSRDSIEFKTYMTVFDPITNAIVQDTFLYDSLKVNKQMPYYRRYISKELVE